jgi:hypothetical protein
MFPGRIIIAGILALAVIAGCTKKKIDKDKDFTSTKTTTAPAASQDIFDEFYKEDTASASKTEDNYASEPVRQAAPAPSFVENGRFVVQVSTVVSRSLADDIAAKLAAKGYPSYIAEVQNPTPALSGTYYRVRIGGFNRVSVARSFGENTLTAEGYEYWVDNRANDNVGLDGSGMGSGGSYYSTETEATTDYNSYAPEPPPPSEPVPTQSYTPEPAAETPPPPTPAEPPAAVPESSPPSGNSEWGNDEW